MKIPDFKLNMALPADKIVSINILRLRRHIRLLSPKSKPFDQRATALRKAASRGITGKRFGG